MEGGLLGYEKKLIVVQSCLASIPAYLMSMIKFPKWAINLINSQMAHCFWDNYEGHHKYHLASWGLLNQKKQYGGMGIPNIADMNLCLLAAWVDKCQRGEQKIWKKIVDAKYRTSNPNILSCLEINAYSPFWKGVLWAAKAAKMGYQWKVGNGRKTKFWEDHWFGSCSLSIQFWELYSIANEHNKTIAKVWDGTNLKISFR